MTLKSNSNPSVTIPAWITRDCASSILFGGLERLQIHFAKPTFYYEKLTDQDRDLPWGFISETEGLFKKRGWYANKIQISII